MSRAGSADRLRHALAEQPAEADLRSRVSLAAACALHQYLTETTYT